MISLKHIHTTNLNLRWYLSRNCSPRSWTLFVTFMCCHYTEATLSSPPTSDHAVPTFHLVGKIYLIVLIIALTWPETNAHQFKFYMKIIIFLWKNHFSGVPLSIDQIYPVILLQGKHLHLLSTWKQNFLNVVSIKFKELCRSLKS